MCSDCARSDPADPVDPKYPFSLFVLDPGAIPAPLDLLSADDNNNDMSPDDRLQGTLDLLILRTLTDEPLHGWAISRRIRERSGDVFQVNQGSLYPALHRLEDEGWLSAEWVVAET